MSSLPRPGFNYRVARRNAWKAIPSIDRPTWAEFNGGFKTSGHDIVEGQQRRPDGLRTVIHRQHVMQFNKSKYAASYFGDRRRDEAHRSSIK